MTQEPSTETSRISISAHYTGYVWYRQGLSQAEFVTPLGRLANVIFRPINFTLAKLAGGNIDTFLLQRHLVLDHLLVQLIEEQGVEQVVELAAGLSPRGFKLMEQYPKLTYLETDLPAMAIRKQRLLSTLPCAPNHQVKACNILQTQGPDSLAAVLAGLDPNEKTVVISEGLVNYFPLAVIRSVWARLARELANFTAGYYLTDLYPDLQQHPSYRYVKVAQKLVGILTRGQWPLHYHSDAAIQQGFEEDGFAKVQVHNPQQFKQLAGIPASNHESLVRLIVAEATSPQ